ncbi:MAG: hypothetical protein M2R45_00691 [Verrucomicrobia subdivision 3 bacterium]|nr:hypothetical protein [Limisphaerales bacterium]MCS1414425.1 hypothetical protein [Limisphaerales bacterium]
MTTFILTFIGLFGIALALPALITTRRRTWGTVFATCSQRFSARHGKRPVLPAFGKATAIDIVTTGLLMAPVRGDLITYPQHNKLIPMATVFRKLSMHHYLYIPDSLLKTLQY